MNPDAIDAAAAPGSTAHTQPARVGVLLLNLGTPDAPTPAAIRRYLREFLSDRRVVELPRLLWLPILYGFILPLRPRRLAHAYASVWGNDGSPLLSISRRIAVGLQQALKECLGQDAPVALAMRYGQPDIASALESLAQQGVRRLLLLPLYPQYSATTTAAALDGVFSALGQRRWLPELRTLNHYHDDPGYIAALGASVRAHWQAHDSGRHLVMSFHGIPRRYFLAGDPYYCHCRKTARLLAADLALQPEQFTVSFQSRFGRAPWLRPYTDQVLPALAARGQREVDVICPGFAADCLETLEEIAIRNRHDFLAAGGKTLNYIPALNDQHNHIAALASLAADHLEAWLPVPETTSTTMERLQRVQALLGEAGENDGP